MNKLRTILIDDKPDSLKSLENSIKANKLDLDIITTCLSGKEGLKAIQKLQPDLVFVEVEMPRMNGFGMLEILDEINFEVIFVSSNVQNAYEAFQFGAAQFLLRPIDVDDLKKAVGRVSKIIYNKKSKQETNNAIDKSEIDDLLKNMQKDSQMRFAIPHIKGYVFYPISDIIYCQGDGNSTKVVTTSKNYISGHHLKKFEERLPKSLFCRIHQSHFVNMHHVQNYYKGKSAYVVMSNGDSLSISESKKSEFVNRFKW